MKDHNEQLKIQACLDGELTGAEARQVEQWLAEDAQAKLLHAELQATRDSLKSHEPEVKLPVPHAFNWSQIQKRIAAEEALSARQAATGFDLLAVLRRYLAPISSLAVLLALAVGIGLLLTNRGGTDLVEVESYSDEVHVSSFHAASEKMFVVWVSAKESKVNEYPEEWEEFYQ